MHVVFCCSIMRLLTSDAPMAFAAPLYRAPLLEVQA
jgi:hypothetical protein